MTKELQTHLPNLGVHLFYIAITGALNTSQRENLMPFRHRGVADGQAKKHGHRHALENLHRLVPKMHHNKKDVVVEDLSMVSSLDSPCVKGHPPSIEDRYHLHNILLTCCIAYFWHFVAIGRMCI